MFSWKQNCLPSQRLLLEKSQLELILILSLVDTLILKGDIDDTITYICKECLQTAPHVSIHDLVDRECIATEIDNYQYSITYEWQKASKSEEVCSRDITYYTQTLDGEATKCIDDMIAGGTLDSSSTVETSHTIPCGFEDDCVLVAAIIGAVIGSCAAVALLLLTLYCMYNDHKQYIAIQNSKTDNNLCCSDLGKDQVVLQSGKPEEL